MFQPKALKYSLLNVLKGKTMFVRNSVKKACDYYKWATKAGLPKDAVRYNTAHLISSSSAELPVSFAYMLKIKG